MRDDVITCVPRNKPVHWSLGVEAVGRIGSNVGTTIASTEVEPSELDHAKGSTRTGTSHLRTVSKLGSSTACATWGGRVVASSVYGRGKAFLRMSVSIGMSWIQRQMQCIRQLTIYCNGDMMMVQVETSSCKLTKSRCLLTIDRNIEIVWGWEVGRFHSQGKLSLGFHTNLLYLIINHRVQSPLC